MVHGISTESTWILKGIRLDQGIRYLSTDQPGFKRTYLKFLTLKPMVYGYLTNLAGFSRVFGWTQGLGTYLPINLDLNAHTSNF